MSNVSLAVVVLPFVPEIIIEPFFSLPASFLIRYGSILRAYRPGAAVAPEPASLRIKAMVLPAKMAMISCRSTLGFYYKRVWLAKARSLLGSGEAKVSA